VRLFIAGLHSHLDMYILNFLLWSKVQDTEAPTTLDKACYLFNVPTTDILKHSWEELKHVFVIVHKKSFMVSQSSEQKLVYALYNRNLRFFPTGAQHQITSGYISMKSWPVS